MQGCKDDAWIIGVWLQQYECNTFMPKTGAGAFLKGEGAVYAMSAYPKDFPKFPVNGNIAGSVQSCEPPCGCMATGGFGSPTNGGAGYYIPPHFF